MSWVSKVNLLWDHGNCSFWLISSFRLQLHRSGTQWTKAFRAFQQFINLNIWKSVFYSKFVDFNWFMINHYHFINHIWYIVFTTPFSNTSWSILYVEKKTTTAVNLVTNSTYHTRLNQMITVIYYFHKDWPNWLIYHLYRTLVEVQICNFYNNISSFSTFFKDPFGNKFF